MSYILMMMLILYVGQHMEKKGPDVIIVERSKLLKYLVIMLYTSS